MRRWIRPLSLHVYLADSSRARAFPRKLEQLAGYFRNLRGRLRSRGGGRLLSGDLRTARPRLARLCRHVPVDRRYTYLNGKVNGVHTGVDLASCENILLADDDIRYRPEGYPARV